MCKLNHSLIDHGARRCASSRALLVAPKRGVISKKFEIEKLQVQIARLHRMEFGPSSENNAGEVGPLVLHLEELRRTGRCPETTYRTRISCTKPRRPARCVPTSALFDNRHNIRSMLGLILLPHSSTRRSWSSPTLIGEKELSAHCVAAACAESFPSEHIFHTK